MAEWENGLCETDCNNCMASWLCICFSFGRAAERIKAFPDPSTENLSTCNGSCFALCAASMFHFGWVPIWLQRRQVRDKFGIHGDGCSDCLTSFFCSCCAVSQMNLELKKRAENEQHVGEGGGYVPPTEMEYTPQP